MSVVRNTFVAATIAASLSIIPETSAQAATSEVVLGFNGTATFGPTDKAADAWLTLYGHYEASNTFPALAPSMERDAFSPQGWRIEGTGSIGGKTISAVETDTEPRTLSELAVDYARVHATPAFSNFSPSLFTLSSLTAVLVNGAMQPANGGAYRFNGLNIAGSTAKLELWDFKIASVSSEHVDSTAKFRFTFKGDSSGFTSIFRDYLGFSEDILLPTSGNESFSTTLRVTQNTGIAPVPVPAALPLLAGGAGLLGLLGWFRRRKVS